MAKIEFTTTMSKDLKYTTWSSVFIAYINLTRRRRLPLQGIYQVDTLYKRQLKYYKQLWMKKTLFSSMYETFYASERHKMVPSALLS
jgi:hypothetical protein